MKHPREVSFHNAAARSKGDAARDDVLPALIFNAVGFHRIASECPVSPVEEGALRRKALCARVRVRARRTFLHRLEACCGVEVFARRVSKLSRRGLSQVVDHTSRTRGRSQHCNIAAEGRH